MNLDPRLLRLARRTGVALSLTIFLGFAAGVINVLQARLLSRVIAGVFLEGRLLGQLSPLLLLLLGAFTLQAVLSGGSDLSANQVALQVKGDLRRRLFVHLMELGPAYTHGERTGELTSLALEGLEALEPYFSQYLPQLALAGLVPLTFLLFVFPLDWISGLVLLLTAPLIPLFMILIGSLAEALTRRQWRTLSRTSAYFLDVLQGLTTLKILGRSRAQAGVIQQVSENFRQTTMRVLRVAFLSALVLEMVATLSTAVVAVEVGLRLLYGQLSFEQAFFVLLLAPQFYLPLRLLGTRFHAGMSGLAAAKRIFEVLETPVEVGQSSQSGVEALPQPFPGVRFENVSYTYPNADQGALQDISFTLKPGEKVALVGPSGAGKSTLASLLLGFLQPTQGRILIGDHPLAGISSQDWRTQVAWVSQNPYLFHDTVAANLRLAKPGATQAELERAARLAHAHDFIQALPQGYETPIGERGRRLSGGQAQRIALARAFLKDAPLLILDEASANLDPEHEACLQAALARLLKDRTALIITHHLGTVVAADRILALKQGRLVEEGPHDELLSRSGLYASLVSAYQGSQPWISPWPSSAVGSVADDRVTPEENRREFEHSASGSPRPGKSTSTLKHGPLARLISLAAPFAGLMGLSALLGFATIASNVGLMSASAYIISAAALHPSIAVLEVPIVAVRFFGITRGLFRYGERYLSHLVTFKLLARLRLRFYQALEPLAPARLAAFHSGDLLARILGDIETLENFYVRVLHPPFVALLTALAVGVFLARYAALLALAWLTFLFLAGVALPWLARSLSRAPGKGLLQDRAVLSVVIVDGIQGLAELLAFGQAGRQLERIISTGERLADSQRRLAQINALQTALFGLLTNLGAWTVLVLAIPLVNAGQLQGVFLAVVVLAALTGFEAAQALPLAAQYLESNLQAARRLFEIIDAQPAVLDPPRPLPPPKRFDLVIEDLDFTYPGSPEAQPALHGFDLRLPFGRRVALVGASGAGKSTLVNLLLRFWEYDGGHIWLCGQELRDYHQDELRRLFAVVSQNTYLFSASLHENLLIARPQATQAEIEQAARRAHLHDFIQSLPEGYDTWVGEQGLRLSGGERQRLAIARALLKDAPMLILDEATANLDAVTERQVMVEIQALMEGRTTLAMTHRLAGLENMDEILVLHAGRVVERGVHADLLRRAGRYRRMWELQNQVIGEAPAVPVLAGSGSLLKEIG